LWHTAFQGRPRLWPPQCLQVGHAGWTSFLVCQARFVGVLIGFHFFFLMLPLCLF